MATLPQNQDDDNAEEEELDPSTNLLSLGSDAWDDSALIDAFNRDINLYKKSHSNQLIDLSKVSNMINFKKAKKINQTIKTKIDNQQNDSDDDDNDDDDDDDDDESKDDVILEPSFIPFANQNRIQKYSQWPPNNDINKQKIIKKNKNKKNKNKNVPNEPENLAKLWEKQEAERLQQQQQQQQYQQYQPYYQYPMHQYPQQSYPIYPGSQASYVQPQPQPQYNPYNPYPTYVPPHPSHPPMPPYVKSSMFNMGLNMMGPPARSKSPNKDEALANMLLSWYWNGYYAGYQAAQNNK